MKLFYYLLTIIIFSFAGCKGQTSSVKQPTSFVDTTSHFYSIIDKAQFDTLTGSDFTWEIFEPINDTLSNTFFDERPAFVKSLSDGQKALFYIWELDRAVIQGKSGFANFYYNYKSYFSETIKGLTLLNDTAMLNVMYGVNKIYLNNYEQIQQKYKSGDWKYIKKQFSFFDRAFIKSHEQTMKLLEDYIRLHTDEFVRFK